MGRLEVLAQDNLCATFQMVCAERPAEPALSLLGSQEVPITWHEYGERVRSIATGLHGLGVRHGDVVAAMLRNRSEFHLVDTAVLHLGGIGCSLYNTTPPERLVPMLENSACRVVVTELAFLDVIREAVGLGGCVQAIVVVDAAEEDLWAGELRLADVEELSAADFDFDETWRSVTGETTACLCYSSGTTGEPKGAEFTHAALMFHVNSIQRLSPPSERGQVISYLPMAHMGERYMSHYSSLAFGYHVSSLMDGSQIVEWVNEVRPTRFFGVPRVYEKIAAAAYQRVDEDPALTLSTKVLRDDTERQSAQRHMPSDAKVAKANEQLAQVRALVGLDRAEFLGLGAAGPPRELLVKLHALGLPVLECYGSTEAVMVTANAPNAFRLGSVGRPMPGVQTRLDPEGELLVKGPGVFSHYRGRPDLTQEAFTDDGWMRTGDIAAIDEHGFHSIVDRKKELIVTATGKNVAPRLIENLLIQASPLIASAAVIGDARRFISALVVFDVATVHERGLTPEAAAQDAQILAELAGAVADVNRRLSRAESVRVWTALPGTWSAGGDELTPTGKLRRCAIVAKYGAEIEKMYEHGGRGLSVG